ncbi:hypothetical protein, partial [Pseudomonas aeruginosa]|uniref:hypothetical protein n=1 Tax=Pseudomonas aeruginosa TaxID=287 RepID=UPI003CC6D6A3
RAGVLLRKGGVVVYGRVGVTGGARDAVTQGVLVMGVGVVVGGWCAGDLLRLSVGEHGPGLAAVVEVELGEAFFRGRHVRW